MFKSPYVCYMMSIFLVTAFLYNIDIKTREKVIGRPLLLKKDEIVMFWEGINQF